MISIRGLHCLLEIDRYFATGLLGADLVAARLKYGYPSTAGGGQHSWHQYVPPLTAAIRK